MDSEFSASAQLRKLMTHATLFYAPFSIQPDDA